MTGSPLRFVTVKTFLGSRLATSGFPVGSERYLSQLERSAPLKSDFHSVEGRVYSGSAAVTGPPGIAAKSETAKPRERIGLKFVEVEVTRPSLCKSRASRRPKKVSSPRP